MGYTYTEKLFIIYLESKLNWVFVFYLVSCILFVTPLLLNCYILVFVFW